jgi:hypothetical protein
LPVPTDAGKRPFIAVSVQRGAQSDFIAAGWVEHVRLPHFVALWRFGQASAMPKLRVLKDDLLV